MGRVVSVGERFGRWTVVGETAPLVSGRAKRPRLLARCECGVERAVDAQSLLRGGSRSCGCLGRPFPQLHDPEWLRREYAVRGRSVKEMTAEVGCRPGSIGKALARAGVPLRPRSGGGGPVVRPGERYGRLVVLSESRLVEARRPTTGRRRGRVFECLCDCGRITFVQSELLRSGNTRSCGCLQRDRAAARLTTHGQSGSPTHTAWKAMRQRCRDPKATNYPRYGGRPDSKGGPVLVCERWGASFDAFLEDMGERPAWADGGIDRIDNDGGYSCGHCEECRANGWPANCRWSTATEQARNRRKAADRV